MTIQQIIEHFAANRTFSRLIDSINLYIQQTQGTVMRHSKILFQRGTSISIWSGLFIWNQSKSAWATQTIQSNYLQFSKRAKCGHNQLIQEMANNDEIKRMLNMPNNLKAQGILC